MSNTTAADWAVVSKHEQAAVRATLDEVRRRVGEVQRDYEAERPGPYITGFLTAIDITLTIIDAMKDKAHGD